ncbi:4-hydroxy-tetrahydrodipicolinate synthase [Haloferax mediterranei ATCC 33500]|uniref:4-hydroxy-tetrahydrodipicolinate synthase n=1 Tax=Haloferax mediterranei (strain ATCC 33500 / DSM 1411 / JCM 8866 / NBRC 14739 / NCIMB 2177 / R-4) TaxID=523841 RepID=I3R3L5_HALMT|nr:4-hydroxy-tetrahydrodipicolinate synthase [Haloferax mediterranei]AFK18825.1 2-dehydro-3-deoxy-(phospho)gluconate aldolase,-type KD(P)G aldolase [Haloferax mediterranei ATCC 33500]AHZ21809.1 4-hydroxy-tetrahydrodipicolinate synthase [Haloferax mediterranei ATCC 33500]EMA03317.1 dihydrodipicolinate synthase [Haloferax mediterranei ATCC 33500]MDX5988918.1 4-hydroxy-tetrahydrodipicolinate synthase [Haloferax mediterranei ATCC 33500]QCQ75316.1 4-hydroxy-tetrahydrodipicolinate synthase [Halofera
MTTFDLRGVYPAMTTPFDEDGSIDFQQLQSDVRRLEAAGVDGLVPVGSTGESATLTHDEHVEVVEAVVEAVEDIPVIAGSGSNSTREALELSRRSADAGADALLLISPYYNKPEQAGLIEHYRTIADEVDLPQIVYNVPGRTGSNILPETVATLAEHPNIVGYKAASGDLGQISQVVEYTREEDFAVLSGDDGLTLQTLAVGGVGTISVVGNIEPARTGAMVHSALQGDYERARDIHHELGPLCRYLFVETNPIPVKEAMEIRGYGPARLRPPLTRLTDEHTEELRRILDELTAESAVPDGGNDA